MTIALVWAQLAGAAIVILVGANFLTKSADVIAVETGLGRAFIGVILLATATSLPELGTGISALVLLGEPDLAAGDAFGSNLFNLMIVGLLDIFWREGPILRSVSGTSVFIGALGITLTTIAGVAVIVHGENTGLSSWYISPMSVTLIVVFVVSVYMILRVEKDDSPKYQPATPNSLYRAIGIYLFAATIVVVGGIWLAQSGQALAHEMAWETSFVGTQFLAFSTSLPELATSFAAIRMKAPELAVTNLLGSNLFNMGFVLFIDDAVYSEGVFWESISGIHFLTAMVAVGMTSVIIISLLGYLRGGYENIWKMSSPLLIGLYVTASLLIFYLS